MVISPVLISNFKLDNAAGQIPRDIQGTYIQSGADHSVTPVQSNKMINVVKSNLQSDYQNDAGLIHVRQYNTSYEVTVQ